MIPRIRVVALLLLLVGGTTGLFARPRSLRSYDASQFSLFHRTLAERFGDRTRHRIISLRHPPIRPQAHHHDEIKRGKLDGPDKDMFEVCFEDDNGYPCDCSLKEEFSIDCRNESLRTANIVPLYDSKDGSKKARVEIVNLKGNIITELWKDRIVPGHEETLTVLILEENEIIYIEDGAFSKMSSLVTLDLSSNRLTTITRKLFAKGEGLEWKLKNLYLGENDLFKIEDRAFEDLTMLEKLVLDDNTELPLTNDTFGNLHSLKQLSLDNCGLEELPIHLFDKLIQLEYLSLRENPLSVVPAPVKALKSLVALDISATFISEFTHDALSGDYKLEKLIARDMSYLWAIEKCAFCGLPNLKEVIFFNCTHLYTIDEEAFGNTTTRESNPLKLELLDLEKCNISSLSENMVDWTQVKTKLGYNPFNCDCNMSWMGNLEIDVSTGDALPSCASPDRLKGRPVTMLRKRELCNGSFRFGRLFVGLTLVLLVSVGIIVGWYVCTTRNRSGNGFRLRNVFYKPQLPRYGYRNLVVKEDEQALANDDYNDQPIEHNKRMVPPPVEV